jgi:putative hydrolase of the HAD superfamily
MAIEALLFDLGKVLVDFDFERGIRRFAARCSVPGGQFAQILMNDQWVRRYECGEITSADYLRYLQESGALQMDIDEFHESWSSVFLPGLIVPESLLASLRQRYPLILVSNTNESHAGFIARQYRVFDYFDHRILSHEVGSMKPDYKIYEAAIAAAGKPPEALFFTDDREENVQAARELGIHAHRFETVEGLLRAFRELGVETDGFDPSARLEGAGETV